MHHCRMIEGMRTTTVKSETETFTDHCPISGVERQELSLQLSVTSHKHVRNIRGRLRRNLTGLYKTDHQLYELFRQRLKTHLFMA